MNSKINIFETPASWTGNFVVTSNAVNEYIADHNSISMIVAIPALSSGKSIAITGTWDFTDYDNVVFHVWSRNKAKGIYNTKDDCEYKIAFGATEFFFRIFPGFTHETIGIGSVTTFTTITITCLHNDADYLILSAMVAEKEELPLDIFDAIGSALDDLYTQKYGVGLQVVSNVTVLAGSRSITLSAPFVGRYAVIKIGSGVTEETHQIDEQTESGFTLSHLYDGPSFLFTHTAEPVYLLFPAIAGIGSSEVEINLPGYSIWGINPEPVGRGTDIDTQLDTFTNTSISVKVEGQIMKYPILIDCESRSYELLAVMSRMVRKLMDTHVLWINGKANDIDWESPAVEIAPTESFDIIPKTQYTLMVEIKEEHETRTVFPVKGPATISATPN